MDWLTSFKKVKYTLKKKKFTYFPFCFSAVPISWATVGKKLFNINDSAYALTRNSHSIADDSIHCSYPSLLTEYHTAASTGLLKPQ